MAKNKQNKRRKKPRVTRPAGAGRASRVMPVGPMLMAPPLIDAGRRFTFALAGRGRGPNQAVTVVEAWFRWPIGLFRLKSSPSIRSEYLRWSKMMCSTRQPRDPTLTERVVVPRSMFERKVWEIGDAVATDRLGDEVDMALAAGFRRVPVAPSHPAMSLDLAAASALSVGDLGRRPERLRAFYQEASLPVLERVWEESGGSRMIKSGKNLAVHRVVRECVQDWGIEALDEVFCDLASYCVAADDRDAAKSFALVAGAGDRAAREDAMVVFLADWVSHHFTRARRL